MPEQKVFISWSGVPSQTVAKALHIFLTEALAGKVQPFVSSEDIGKGTRGLNVIAAELENAMFGVVVVTHENLGSVWVNFEAGALSRMIDEAFVAPVLVGIADADVVGPLKQFQNTDGSDRDDMLKLVLKINDQLDDKLPETSVTVLFDNAWSVLKRAVTASAAISPTPPAEKRPKDELLDEILTTVRGLQRTVDKLEVPTQRTSSSDSFLESVRRVATSILLRSGTGLVTWVSSTAKDVARLDVTADQIPEDVVADLRSLSKISGLRIQVVAQTRRYRFAEGEVDVRPNSTDVKNPWRDLLRDKNPEADS
ncbi:TIR domain-containing protein [Plantibacter sp. CFBP 13570]|uniref:TIR domain-containing protein n=1 Tax=Plantibacter sp. CFBP 13570 TaxID=2775272 RepID=UPI0019309616|nr:TIR domain-containing protein [Plantibacter sp. CFBP 13570]MBD8537118.1 toll/interleukin-1 receptor domain-containing protein [Plantibacter sp. CFBP 13570]